MTEKLFVAVQMVHSVMSVVVAVSGLMKTVWTTTVCDEPRLVDA